MGSMDIIYLCLAVIWHSVCVQAFSPSSLAGNPISANIRIKSETLPLSAVKRVTGGSDAAEGNFTYQASVLVLEGRYWYHICGGTLVAVNKVITAAHCVVNNSRPLAVGLGFNDFGDTKHNNEFQLHRVSGVTTYEGYEDDQSNDIAILTLAVPAKLTKAVQLIPIATGSEDYSNTQCDLTGWGTQDTGSNPTGILQYAPVTVIPNELCSWIYGPLALRPIGPMSVCSRNIGSSSCSGDSGGPLVCDGYLVGIVSWGDAACDGILPSVYTRVSFYATWINDQIELSGNSVPAQPKTLEAKVPQTWRLRKEWSTSPL